MPTNNENVEAQTVIEEPDNTPLTREDWDVVLENALLQACKTSAKKIELPILSSNFYRTHILTALPPGMVFDVKKTSYKKLSKFLIWCRDQSKALLRLLNLIISLISKKFMITRLKPFDMYHK